MAYQGLDTSAPAPSAASPALPAMPTVGYQGLGSNTPSPVGYQGLGGGPEVKSPAAPVADVSKVKAPDTSNAFSKFVGQSGILPPHSSPFIQAPAFQALPDVNGKIPSIPGIPKSVTNQNASLSATPEEHVKNLKTESDFLSKENTSLSDTATQIKNEKAKVDPTNQKSIDKFNKDLAAYNDRLTSYQTRATTYNTNVQKNNDGQAVYQKPNSFQSTLFDLGVKFPVNPVTDFIGGTVDDSMQKLQTFFGTLSSKNSPSARIGAGVNVALGIANTLFMPITGALKVADQIPGINIGSKAIEDYSSMTSEALSRSVGVLIDQIPSKYLSDSAKSNLEKPLGDAAGFLEQVFLGDKTAETVTPLIKAKLDEAKTILTKDIITKTFPGKSAYFNTAQIKDIWQTGTLLSDAEKADVLKTIGSDSADIKDALKNGVSVKVSPRTLVTLEDKPYWSAIKSFFGAKDAEPVVLKDIGGESSQTVRGLLPEKGDSPSPTPPVNEVHPALEGEVKDSIAKFGEDHTIQILQDNAGLSATGAEKVVAEVKANEAISNPEKIAAAIEKPPTSLAEEVKKYKSAEDFVKAQGETLYHGTRVSIRNEKGLFSLTDNKNIAENYASGAGGLRSIENMDFNVYEAGNRDGFYKAIPDGKQLKYVRSDGKELSAYDVESLQRGGQASPQSSNAKIHEFNVPKDTKILTLESPNSMNNYSKTSEGTKLLSTLDAKGDKFAQAIINDAKKGIFDWGNTKYPNHQKAWKEILIPQLEEKGYKAIKYNDEGSMTTAVFNVGELKTKSQLEDIYNQATKETKPTPKPQITKTPDETHAIIQNNGVTEVVRGLKKGEDPLTKLTPEQAKNLGYQMSTEKGRAEAVEKPVGSGEVKVSRFAERIAPDANNPTYQVSNHNEQLQKAADFVTQYPERAQKISEGIEAPPEGLLKNAVSRAYADSLLKAGDSKATSVINSTTLRSSRYGQELEILKGNSDINSPEYWFKQIQANRMGASDIIYKAEQEGKLKSVKAQIANKISSEVKEVKGVLTKSQLKIETAQAILDKLLC